jgi:hypothetical protein
LQAEGIDFEMEDNAFVRISDWKRAQELASGFSVKEWEMKFHALVASFCPAVEKSLCGYHWSVMQVEHSLDVVFKKREVLAPLYEEISRQAVVAVRVPDMARFWSKRYSPEAEAQSDFKTVVQGTRIKHSLGRQSIKMDDKGGRVRRIETSSNDITFFRHYRKVVGRDGQEEYKMAALKKSIYSLSDVVEILGAACQRYLDFLGTLEDQIKAHLDLDPISAPVRDSLVDRSWSGFNLFLKKDRAVLLAILHGEFSINGLGNKCLRALLANKNSADESPPSLDGCDFMASSNVSHTPTDRILQVSVAASSSHATNSPNG